MKGTSYEYDQEGFLVRKIEKDGKTWYYHWQGNGMLKQVVRPDRKTVSFEYDALGRRTAKIFEDSITRWIWDGNTPLHEWKYDLKDRPQAVVNEFGQVTKDKAEPTDNLITWVFDQGSFRPAAKIEADKKYSIINDYLGTPKEAYDYLGNKIWEIELEAYGKVRTCSGDKSFIPFRFQGQYEDQETGLYYNRFRYYSPEEGMYVTAQDPIGLGGGGNLYGYVNDPNAWIDVLGLTGILSEELAKIAREVHDLAKPSDSTKSLIGFNQSTVAVARIEVDGVSNLYAAGNGARLSRAQVDKLVELGVPRENIFTGKKFHLDVIGINEAETKKLTNLANHAERVIDRNKPKGAVVTEWGISWASKQKNEMCDNCKIHFGCH